MPRFFVEKENVHSDHIIIKGEDVNHIKKVLRLSKGDEVELCDGLGNDYIAKIYQLEASCIHTEIISSRKSDTEPPINITLYQGIPKGDKMDMIVQKSVELGVNKVVPVLQSEPLSGFKNQKMLIIKYPDGKGSL